MELIKKSALCSLSHFNLTNCQQRLTHSTFSLRISSFFALRSSFSSCTRCSRFIAEALRSAISCSWVSKSLAKFTSKLGGVFGHWQVKKTKPHKLLIKDSFPYVLVTCFNASLETYINKSLADKSSIIRNYVKVFLSQMPYLRKCYWRWVHKAIYLLHFQFIFILPVLQFLCHFVQLLETQN